MCRQFFSPKSLSVKQSKCVSEKEERDREEKVLTKKKKSDF